VSGLRPDRHLKSAFWGAATGGGSTKHTLSLTLPGKPAGACTAGATDAGSESAWPDKAGWVQTNKKPEGSG